MYATLCMHLTKLQPGRRYLSAGNVAFKLLKSPINKLNCLSAYNHIPLRCLLSMVLVDNMHNIVDDTNLMLICNQQLCPLHRVVIAANSSAAVLLQNSTTQWTQS